MRRRFSTTLIGGSVVLLLACAGGKSQETAPAAASTADEPKQDTGPAQVTSNATPWNVNLEVEFSDSGVDAMAKVAKLHQAQLGVCGPESGVPGEVKIAVALDDGKINGTIVRKHAPKQQKTAECVADKIRKWVFPAGMSGEAIFRANFEAPQTPRNVDILH